MEELNGRRVLVTGASSGIGAATVRACAAAGASVAGLARREERLATLVDEVGAAAVVADITDEPSARRAVDEAAGALGGLDAVVNNAGVMLLGGVAEGRTSDWRRMLDVNVFGLLVVSSAALRHLREAGGGDIVNVSSMAGRRVPSAAGGVYAGTKHAVHAISDGMRREFHGEGVRVTLVSPGVVATELGHDIADASVRERVERNQSEIGLTPDDVARQIVRILAEPPTVTLHEVALLPTAQG